MFLFAGMDSISSGLNFALYEMITRRDELEKLRKEVDSIFDPTLEVICLSFYRN
jgi:cytochrome P450